MNNKILSLILIMVATFSRAAVSVSINTQATPNRTLSSRVGDCVQGKSTAYLEANNIRAILLNSGDLWWDRTNAGYEAPKRSKEQIQNKERFVAPLYSGSIWVSGKVGGNLRMAATTYSIGGRNNFWPGPITGNASSVQRERCDRFDKFWKVTSTEIKQAIEYQTKGTGSLPQSVKEWPGKGNSYLVSTKKMTTAELAEPLAPFYDFDGDCIYDPEKGDLPAIKMVSNNPSCVATTTIIHTYADEMVFWVINDVGNNHVGPSTTPIGIQMNCLAFAFASSDELNNMTFYSYDIWNKSNVTLEETYMSQNMDADLGNFNDDYVGCDTVRSLGYIYNADAFDETSTVLGYLDQPPIFGADFFEGPKKNGVPIGMSSFLYYRNGANGNDVDPDSDLQFRNYQEGKNRAGQSLTITSTCYQAGGTPTKYCYSGDPAKTGEWSMCNGNQPIIQPFDLRWLQNSGPFDMVSSSHETITIGLIFVRPPKGSQVGCIPQMQYLREADDKAQRLFDAGFKRTPGPDAPDLKIVETSNSLHFTLNNSESSNNFGETYDKTSIDIPLNSWNPDTTYTFEGYAIYQIISENAISNLNDLKDNDKAKLLKVMDVKNGIKRGVNFTEEDVNGTRITNIDQDLTLPDEGIEREITVEKDLFQFEGVPNLVNNKTYYYATVAFAYNNYKNLGNPAQYQKRQLSFSNTVKIFKGTPHNENFWGVKLNSKFNQGLEVKRISGQGHGAYFLDLANGEESKILLNNKQDELKYKGGYSPIKAKIIDPFKVKNAKYRLTIADTSITNNVDNFALDSAFWKLDIMEGGSTKTIYSEGNLDREFSQSIYANISNKLESYGIAVGTSFASQVNRVARTGRKVYGAVGGEISYQDSAKKWLNLIADESNKDYYDWIRTGENPDLKYGANYNIINNVKVYADSSNAFADILDGMVAPYCLTANTNVTANLPANNYQSFSPGFKWKRIATDSATMANFGEGPENNLDSIFSFDLVITPDKNNWSRCIVFETGESPNFTEGGALKGQIRKAVSLDKNFDPESDTGKSWFPGYAINLETGVRMNLAFGENSRFRGKGGANMVWDPDSLTTTVLGNPIMGGGHFVYIMNTEYSEVTVNDDATFLLARFNSTTGAGVNQVLNTEVARYYRNLSWAFFPLTKSGYNLYDDNGNYTIPTQVRIKVRVEKPYRKYLSNESVYEFSTEGLASELGVDTLVRSAFNRITVVPNPYYAFSAYELNATQNTVKIVNVPPNSTISIYTTDGMLVRKMKLDGSKIGDGYYGENVSSVNYDNSIDWDLRTSSGVLVASGVYYINIDAGNLGSKVLKLFAVMRSADVSNF